MEANEVITESEPQEDKCSGDPCSDEAPGSIQCCPDASIDEKTKENAAGATNDETKPCEMVEFKFVWNKTNYDIVFDVNRTLEELKKHIEELTGIPSNMQKVMYKGLIKDFTQTLKDTKITKGAKLMVIGSTLKDVLQVTPPPPGALKETKDHEGAPTKEPLSKQKMHRKVLDKGKPDDVLPGIKGVKENLPRCPLSGMYNKANGKVRLTFKLELDQLWIGTRERTEKIPMTSIRNVVSEPIEGFEEHHILGLQLGPTEGSRYWIYWVPAQYVDAIKDTILGKWQAF